MKAAIKREAHVWGILLVFLSGVAIGALERECPKKFLIVDTYEERAR